MTKLYVSLAKLRRSEWSRETTCGVSADALELVLRGCMRSERGEWIGAHTALFFEDPTPQMLGLNAAFGSKRQASFRGDFWIDILVDGDHRVSYVNDPDNWYRAWDDVEIELYEVVGLSTEQIAAAQRASLDIVLEHRPYDPCRNINSLVPCCCVPCGSICCFGNCCALCTTGRCVCGRGVTCVSAVMAALAVAKGGSERTATRTLGVPWRPVLGAFLPAELVRELVKAGVLNPIPKPLALDEVRSVATGVTPLLLLRV